jgi:hypothetical protein
MSEIQQRILSMNSLPNIYLFNVRLYPMIRLSTYRLITVFFFIPGIFKCTLAGAQTMDDTTLIAMHGRYFFYNVVESGNGDVYAGTSKGIYRMDGTEPIRVDDRTGYVKMNPKGKPDIDPNGIRLVDQKAMVHLLPYPDEQRDEFHAIRDRFLYVVSGGRMHVFEIRPYGYAYRNHSIRSISQHFTGTYSGIYYQGRKMPVPPFPPFTDGHIRELNGKVFIPFDSLSVYDHGSEASGLRRVNGLFPKGMDLHQTNDIRYVPSIKSYLISTNRSLYLMDSAGRTFETILQISQSEGPVTNLFHTEHVVYFAARNRIYTYNFYDKQRSDWDTLPETIRDGAINGLFHYILCPSGLYAYNRETPIRKILDLQRAHTLISNRDGELIIGTDAGLYHYDLRKQKLSALIDGVEFNHRALFLDGNILYAGSINGLYMLDNGRIADLIRNRTFENPEVGSPRYLWPALGISIIISLITGLLYIRARRQIREVEDLLTDDAPEESSRPVFNKEDIEQYIRENLTNVSLKSIKEHFRTNNAHVYGLLEPEKPGTIIQRLRMEIVSEMRSQGATARDISQKTGLSESYVRRVWNR